jgi:hypothetical protein
VRLARVRGADVGDQLAVGWVGGGRGPFVLGWSGRGRNAPQVQLPLAHPPAPLAPGPPCPPGALAPRAPCPPLPPAHHCVLQGTTAPGAEGPPAASSHLGLKASCLRRPRRRRHWCHRPLGRRPCAGRRCGRPARHRSRASWTQRARCRGRCPRQPSRPGPRAWRLHLPGQRDTTTTVPRPAGRRSSSRPQTRPHSAPLPPTLPHAVVLAGLEKRKEPECPRLNTKVTTPTHPTSSARTFVQVETRQPPSPALTIKPLRRSTLASYIRG